MDFFIYAASSTLKCEEYCLVNHMMAESQTKSMEMSLNLQA